MTSPTDDQLIAAYRRGEVTALEILIERYLPAICGYCQQLIFDRALAEDLAQETFVKVIRSLGTFQGAASFRTWLYRIAANVVRDAWSKNRNEVSFVDSEHLVRTAASPEVAVLEAELDEAIRLGLAELPLLLRNALVLTTLQGFSPQEVAELEGCKTSTIYWRVHEARKLLKQRLQSWMT